MGVTLDAHPSQRYKPLFSHLNLEMLARSSAGEHHLDTVGVVGSIPIAPTIYPPPFPSRLKRHISSNPIHPDILGLRLDRRSWSVGFGGLSL